ncbi:MAG: SDR family NAD(P)-dependent oxidoreductase [Weeksellaceae bacterium]|jgi:NAD(P)-dependent dehydrogenase (short-subunit alcohol dehydrogenase family)|nr:SDR family NAD(P)-dependent oxidoreductase [Weeksellaceae bacterium]
MDKKVVVITGSSSGIGKTLANYFAVKGHVVYGLSRSKCENQDFVHISTDVTDFENVYRSIQQVLDESERIDVLINNAGIGMLGTIEDVKKEDFDKLLNVNVYGVIYTMQVVLPLMRKQGSGHIVNISSIASNHGLPFRGCYSASKSAVDRITESVRLENQNTGIEIFSLSLGDIKTSIAESRIYSTVSPYYKESYLKLQHAIDEEVGKGLAPEQIAPKIEKFIYKKNLKSHYTIGKPVQKYSITLKRILGQRYFEKLVARYSRLD